MRIILACAAAMVAHAIYSAPGASALPGFTPCPPYKGYQIDVMGVPCEDAWRVDAYDWEGDKFQAIMEYDCYSSTIDQKPIVLTCVSQQGELVVSE
jgi:hypothetical protein